MKRRLKLKPIIVIILLISLSLLIWARYISTNGLIIKEYKVVNKNLLISFAGLKIVHFSDIHYGRTIFNKELEYLVKEINKIKPDLIFFTGDLIDKDIDVNKDEINEITKILSKLESNIGAYFVTGNHDITHKEYLTILKNSGFKDLNNDYDVLYSEKNENIFIAGLESEHLGKPDTLKINEYLDKNKHNYKILLLHTPDSIEMFNDNTFNLVLAGHSHNGQVRLPFIGSFIYPPGSIKYNNPYYKVNKKDLYISSGIGTSNLNFRFLNKPSFNFYRLNK